MIVDTDWIVITGPPASGKTTLLDLLEEAGEKVSADSTRELIAEVVAEGRDAEEFRFAEDFQPRTLQAMLTAERSLDTDDRVFLEYALPCNIAFHRTEGLELTPGLAAAAEMFKYRLVFILDALEWEADEQRVEDRRYQLAVHQQMHAVYSELGYDPIAVPAVSPKERLAFVRRCLAALA